MKVKPIIKTQIIEKVIYELADISPYNRWICMTDGSYRVHPRYEGLLLKFFFENSIKATKRKPLLRISFMDYLSKTI